MGRLTNRRGVAGGDVFGVLALQGDVAEHVRVLESIGVEPVEVRLPRDLEEVSALILPGGESTTMRLLIDRWGLREPILDLAKSGAPLFGTCAGMILLAREIAGGEEPVLQWATGWSAEPDSSRPADPSRRCDMPPGAGPAGA